MIINYHRQFASSDSECLSLTFDKTSAKLAFFGIEAGGRLRDRHSTYNLLLPGLGGIPGAFRKEKVTDCKIGENSLRFENKNGAVSEISVLDKRTFEWALAKAPKNDLLSLHFNVKTAPPTVWSPSIVKKELPKAIPCADPLVMAKHRYELPLIVHFPDFGRVRIEAVDGDVYCVEELRKSAEYVGLGLGFQNFGYHNAMNALHYGTVSLSFRAKDEGDVKLKLTVMEENYPALPFEGADSHDWDGLRRCWMNSFSVNRQHFDMGDNIVLTGMAHLSVHMKSDLLQVMGGDDENFAMVRRLFERQMMNSFLYAQAEDGEINFNYYKRKKEKPMCEFIDSTPGAVIATAGIAHWNLPFAKKLLPYALKTADYIMSLDKDGDGLFEVPFDGNYMRHDGEPEPETGRQRNWWDNFAFGHKDIYFNCLCHRALREISELLCRIRRGDEAKKYRAQLEKFDKNFFDTFYNPESGVMAGWVSQDGKKHDYMFTFAISMPIDEGLIPIPTGRKMMKILLAKMKKEGYGDLRYGIPGNVSPVAECDTIIWPCMTDWGRYENGGLSGMNGFHFLTAMYKVGLRDEADAIFKAILNTYENEFTHTGLMPGYVQSVDWRTKEGKRCGYNYLADNYYFLLAAYTGKGGIKHPAVVR